MILIAGHQAFVLEGPQCGGEADDTSGLQRVQPGGSGPLGVVRPEVLTQPEQSRSLPRSLGAARTHTLPEIAAATWLFNLS
jgi:hypothetical protein